jgi:EpsI family protein
VASIGNDRIAVFVALAIVVTAAAIGLASSLALLHHNWTLWYAANEHGYLVLAASLWIAAVAWRANPPKSLRPAWWALVPLAALVALIGLLELLLINNTRLVLLPPLVLAAIALVFGYEPAKRLFWPTAFLYFALPQWNVINGLLQALTTAVVTALVRVTQVPAFVEGNFVHLPSGVFEIASGCSGLNYLQTGTALAAFYALLYLRDWRHGLVLLAVGALAALASNWIRVYILILVGHLSDMQNYLIAREHHTFGWLLFLVAMSPVLFFALRLENREARQDRPPDAEPATRRPILPSVVSYRIVAAAVTAAAVLLLPRTMTPGAAPSASASTALPASLDASEPRIASDGDWQPSFINAQEDRASFGGASPAVDVYRAVYPQQDSEHRLIQPSQDFLGRGFELIEQQQRDLQLEAGGTLKITEYRGVLRGRPRLVWAWYWVAGIPVASTLDAKLAEIRGLLQGRHDGVAVALAAQCVPDCDAARDRLAAFTRLHEPRLNWSANPVGD